MGLVYIKPFLDSGTIGLWDTGDLRTDHETVYPLTADEQKELKELKSEKRKKEWLSVRLLLKAMSNNEDRTLAYHPSGKPYLPGTTQGISVTHSGKYTALLLSHTGKPGIDIQCFNPSILNAPEYFLTEKEQQEIGEENKFVTYHLYWCAKETFYKCFSESDPDIRNDIYIAKPAGPVISGRIKSNNRLHDASVWAEQTEEYILTACVI